MGLDRVGGIVAARATVVAALYCAKTLQHGGDQRIG